MKIKTGTYFGESLGYSDDELLLTSDKMVYTRKSSLPSEELPDRVNDLPMSRRTWEKVSKWIDWEVLNSLPDRIGRPDERDQGGEFVEVVEDDRKKRIDFEPGSPPPAIEELVKVLQGLRREAAAKVSD